MKKKLFVCFMVLTVLVTFGLKYDKMAEAQQQQKVFKLKFSTPFPVSHRMVTDGWNLWVKEIEEKTNGRIQIESYHASTLVPMAQTRDALLSGLVDIAYLQLSDLPRFFPISTALSLPFMVTDSRHAAELGHSMWEHIPEIKEEWKPYHLVGLYSTDVINLFTSNKLVKKVNDLQGMRICSPMAKMVQMAQLWPCSSQHVTSEDLYVSLQRKMADGVIFPNAPMRAWRLTDICSNATMGNFAVGAHAIVISKKTWEKLPEDIKEIINDFSQSTIRLLALCLYNEGQWVIQALKDRGDNFYYLSAEEKNEFKEPLEPLYNAWVNDVNKLGFDGKAILSKIENLSVETEKNPYTKIDEWWTKGRMGKLKD